MILTYKSFANLEFPVFRLPSDNWDSHDGLLFIDDELVDDKNMPGDTLGKRRLQTPFKELLPLKKAATSYISMIKTPAGHYIDNKGRVFTYEKTLVCPLKYFRIKEVVRKDVASVLYLRGIKKPFTIPRPPALEMQWAGVLYLHGFPWQPYEYSREKLKDTRRKI